MTFSGKSVFPASSNLCFSVNQTMLPTQSKLCFSREAQIAVPAWVKHYFASWEALMCFTRSTPVLPFSRGSTTVFSREALAVDRPKTWKQPQKIKETGKIKKQRNRKNIRILKLLVSFFLYDYTMSRWLCLHCTYVVSVNWVVCSV